MKNKFKLLSTCMAVFVLSNTAFAAIPGFYLGGGLGYSVLADFSDASKAGGSTYGGGGTGSGGLGERLFLGYNFNHLVGIEANFANYAKTNYQYDDYPVLTFDYTLQVISLVGKGYINFKEDSPFNLYLMLGFAQAYGKGDIYMMDSGLTSSSNNALVGTVGAGASYIINKNVTASFEYSCTGGKSGDDNTIGIPQANMFSLNLAYSFGG